MAFVSRAENKVNYRQLYDTNNDFKAYVDKYCVAHSNISFTTALQHKLVQEAGDMYSQKPSQHEPGYADHHEYT